jgi:hypothetical protein
MPFCTSMSVPESEPKRIGMGRSWPLRTRPGLALQLTLPKRTAGIGRHAVRALEHGHDTLVFTMTGDARVGATTAVRHLGVGRGLGRHRDRHQEKAKAYCDRKSLH